MVKDYILSAICTRVRHSVFMASVALTLAIYVLAVMRLTKLVNSDIILDPVRIKIAHRYGPGSTIVYFLGCAWCVGMWLSLLLAIPTISFLGWSWWLLIPLGLACSQIVGMFAPLYSEDEIDFEPVDEG
jgi:hypothetical protein